MDRAGLPLRTGPDSVDLVIADIGALGLRGELGIGAAIAAVAALVCGGLVSAVTLVFAQFSWVPVLATTGGVFGVAAVALTWQVLYGIRRIEFRPADAPEVIRVVGSLGADEHPLAALRRVVLRHKLVQSTEYPFVARTFGPVRLRLEFDDETVRDTLPETVDVTALADRLRELVRPAGVPVAVETESAGYDPEVADDVLPRDGAVLGVMARRVRGRFTALPGYLSFAEVREAWPAVWDVWRATEANGVRTRTRRSTAAGGREVSWLEYRAVDVQRVVDAIADGTAVLDPAWRTDTEQGRAAYAATATQRRRRA